MMEKVIYDIVGTFGDNGKFNNTFDHCGYTINGIYPPGGYDRRLRSVNQTKLEIVLNETCQYRPRSSTFLSTPEVVIMKAPAYYQLLRVFNHPASSVAFS